MDSFGADESSHDVITSLEYPSDGVLFYAPDSNISRGLQTASCRLQPFCDMIRMQTETEIICFMLSVKQLK